MQPGKPDTSQANAISLGIARRRWIRRAVGAALTCTAIAFLSCSFFAVGAILLVMGVVLMTIRSPKPLGIAWTQRRRMRLILTAARIVFSTLLIIIGLFALGYTLLMAAMVTDIYFNPGGMFFPDTSPIDLVAAFGLVLPPLLLCGIGYVVLGWKLGRRRWGEASGLLLLMGVITIAPVAPLVLMESLDGERAIPILLCFVGCVLLTGWATHLSSPQAREYV